MIVPWYSWFSVAFALPFHVKEISSILLTVTLYSLTVLVVSLILMFPVILAAGIVNCVLSSLR